MTLSDARQGAACAADSEGTPVPRDSSKCLELFRKACGLLSDLLDAASPDTSVVILESYLCTEKGDLKQREPYGELAEINKTNALLKKHYDILKDALPRAAVIKTEEAAACGGTDLYFTDRLYEYGAVPSHLNELANRKLASAVQERLGL